MAPSFINSDLRLDSGRQMRESAPCAGPEEQGSTPILYIRARKHWKYPEEAGKLVILGGIWLIIEYGSIERVGPEAACSSYIHPFIGRRGQNMNSFACA